MPQERDCVNSGDGQVATGKWAINAETGNLLFTDGPTFGRWVKFGRNLGAKSPFYRPKTASQGE
jgi:hypothetical protein